MDEPWRWILGGITILVSLWLQQKLNQIEREVEKNG